MKLILVLIVMGRWMLMARRSCEIIPVLIVMGKWRLMTRGSCGINTSAYCDGKMEVDGKRIMWN